MPRLAVARHYGGIEGVDLVDIPRRDPAGDEVLIGVRAAGVNPSDVKSIRGMFGRDETRLPLWLGAEASGTVIAVGADVRSVRPGDDVVAFRVEGAFADELTARADSVFVKPESLGWEQAAALLLSGTTAWHLVERVAPSAGEVVLIHGAAGGVGAIATQLCRRRRATVIGTASTGRIAAVAALGATPVASGDGLVERVERVAPKGVDAILDTVGLDQTILASAALAVDMQRVAVISGYALAAEHGMLRLGFAPGADPGTAVREAARNPLLELSGAGELTIEIARSFSLSEIRVALRLVGSGRAGGKVVVTPGADR